MKNLLVSLLFLTLVFGGCKTTPEAIAYKSLATISVSVNAAVHSYWDYRDSHPGKVSNATDDRIKQLYTDYQNAFQIAETAQKISAASGQPVSPDVVLSVTTASDKFVSLVAAVNPDFKPSK